MKIKNTIYFFTIVLGIYTHDAHAKKFRLPDFEAIGDTTQIIVPAMALGMALHEKEWGGGIAIFA